MLFLALCCASRGALAQEFGVYAGPLAGRDAHSYSWAMEYQEGFGKYFAGSITWLNEGHIPGHHRDGNLVQLWARLPMADRRVVLAVGAGPYRYFDTVAAQEGAGYSNSHGWGMVYSVRATWYAWRRWTANLQLNRVQVSHGPSTTAFLVGVGYQLDAPDTPGARDWAVPRSGRVSGNEITLLAGETILNSPGSPSSAAEAIEYRHGLGRFTDVTLGYLHEGHHNSARRDGVTLQLWLTRAFLDDRLTLGAGAGGYAALHHGEDASNRQSGDGILSGIVSLSMSYRMTRHWTGRIVWNRVVTRYSRDTDVLLAGVGYRF